MIIFCVTKQPFSRFFEIITRFFQKQFDVRDCYQGFLSEFILNPENQLTSKKNRSPTRYNIFLIFCCFDFTNTYHWTRTSKTEHHIYIIIKAEFSLTLALHISRNLLAKKDTCLLFSVQQHIFVFIWALNTCSFGGLFL